MRKFKKSRSEMNNLHKKIKDLLRNTFELGKAKISK